MKRPNEEKPYATVTTFHDITQHKLAEEAVRTSAEQFRAVTQSANDAIISMNSRGQIISWNKGAEAIFGYAEQDALYDDAGIATARWLTYPDEKVRRDFERDRAASLATDVDGNPVYLAPNRFNLQVAMERWPQVGFHATREHGQRMAQG